MSWAALPAPPGNAGISPKGCLSKSWGNPKSCGFRLQTRQQFTCGLGAPEVRKWSWAFTRNLLPSLSFKIQHLPLPLKASSSSLPLRGIWDWARTSTPAREAQDGSQWSTDNLGRQMAGRMGRQIEAPAPCQDDTQKYIPVITGCQWCVSSRCHVCFWTLCEFGRLSGFPLP